MATLASIAAPAGQAEPAPARARVVVEHVSVAPGGSTTIGVHFDIDPNWHIYWPGQNDSGAATVVNWKLPDGWKVESLQWPAPVRHLAEGDILDHVYEKSVTLTARLTAPKTVKPGDKAVISAEAEWLVCKSACLPGAASLSAEISIAETAAPGKDARLFEAARATLPKPPGSTVKMEWSERTMRLTVAGAEALAFYPHESSTPIDNLIQAGEVRGQTIALAARAGSSKSVTGVLMVRRPAGKREYYAIDSVIGGPKPDDPDRSK